MRNSASSLAVTAYVELILALPEKKRFPLNVHGMFSSSRGGPTHRRAPVLAWKRAAFITPHAFFPQFQRDFLTAMSFSQPKRASR